ncbi:MAG: NUDIX hydrolase [Clostridia bacterium]|nr:NUDIX hydrolase [Clostridia bacterium]
MIFEEKTVESKKLFEGRIIDLRVETVEFPDGKTAYRELVDHPGGVGILALTKDGKIPLVRQFRKPIEKAIWEIPAGKLDKNEEPKMCGIRELKEETGYIAKEIVSLGFLYPSPGFANEVTHIFFAKGLEKGEVSPDEDEYLDIEEFSVDDVRKMILNNEINDAKSVIAFLKCDAMNLFER